MGLLVLIILGLTLWSVLGVGTHAARSRSTDVGWNRAGLRLLPGDVHYRSSRTRVYAPLMSSLLISLVLSVVLTLLLNAVIR